MVVPAGSGAKALDVLRRLVEATSMTTGQAFFEALVVNLPRALGGSHALVGELSGPAQRQTRTLAVGWNGQIGENFVYDLAGTPCETVLARGELAYYPAGVADLFPRDRALRRLGVEAYMGTPLRAADGSHLGMLVVMHDRALDESTEPASILRIFAERAAAELQRRRDEERLRLLQAHISQGQKLEALGRLAGALIHDFNNLLTAIYGGCDLALLEAVPRPAREAIVDVQTTAKRGSELVRQLLAFARRQPTQPQVVVVRDVLERLRPIMGQVLGKQIRTELEWGDEPLRVFIDPTHLEQAIVNLLANARDALDGSGTVRVRADRVALDEAEAMIAGLPSAGSYVAVVVSDDGCGMAPETLRRACEPFFTTKDPERGSGLGLASCHGIVSQAGGALLIESELGRGTSVKLLFPLDLS